MKKILGTLLGIGLILGGGFFLIFGSSFEMIPYVMISKNSIWIGIYLFIMGACLIGATHEKKC